jgi:polyhydroxybutyrate depolymerase
VFAWHGLGGTAERTATGTFSGGYYGLESRAGGTAILVTGQGLETSNSVGTGPGWDNSGGRDVAFTSAMIEWLRANYCIDDARIFSVGMSYGGIMSNTVGCELGDVFRAIAPMAGMGPMTFGGATCVGQVAACIAHGNADTVVDFSSGQASRDYWAGANHGAATTTPAGSNGCVAYEGCDAGYPVLWCEFDGGHTVPSFSGDEIWAFFSQF